MSDLQLIQAVKNGDRAMVSMLIGAGAEINQQDDRGWTPLNFAAGKGDVEMVQLLVAAGADPLKTGRDMRTPYKIALAAGHAAVVTYLKEVEDARSEKPAARAECKYCKAYHLKDLRRFPGWSERRGDLARAVSQSLQEPPGREGSDEMSDEMIVYLHENFTLTTSMWQNEGVIFDQVDENWKRFCREELDFRPPDDLDLIADSRGA